MTSPGDDYVLKVEGFCPVCEQESTFAAKDPWLRDHFLCLNCSSQPRWCTEPQGIEGSY